MELREEKKRQHISRIVLMEDWEIKYWSKVISVSLKPLKEEVKKLNNIPEKVKEFMKVKHYT